MSESGKIIYSLEVSKNYFSQVYGHIFGQKGLNGGHFGLFWGAKMTRYVKICGNWSKFFP